MSEFDKPLTKLPRYLDDEDAFLQLAEIQLSLRQMMTIVLGAVAWWLAGMLTGAVVGMVVQLPQPLLWAMYSWVILGALFLALKKKDVNRNGLKVPYEEYLTKRLLFNMAPNEWVVKDARSDVGSIEDADWRDFEDDDTGGWGGSF
jgi:hypothetical protein